MCCNSDGYCDGYCDGNKLNKDTKYCSNEGSSIPIPQLPGVGAPRELKTYMGIFPGYWDDKGHFPGEFLS